MRDTLFFIALIPDETIQREVTGFKRECELRFNASHALTSPPHITLHPPFPWPDSKLDILGDALDGFAAQMEPFAIELKGFNCFKPRVIFVDVKPNDKLKKMQVELTEHLKNSVGLNDERGIRFHAHMTIAHRDLKHWIFPEAWSYFSNQDYVRTFRAENISLMEHKHGRWEVYEDYPLE